MWTSRVIKVCSLVGVFAAGVGLSSVAESATLGDEQAHAGVSFAFNTAVYLSMRTYGFKKTESLFTAATVSVLAGAIKEVGDDRPSSSDLNADLAGVGASFTILFLVDWFD